MTTLNHNQHYDKIATNYIYYMKRLAYGKKRDKKSRFGVQWWT